jgi:hypothetical protein
MLPQGTIREYHDCAQDRFPHRSLVWFAIVGSGCQINPDWGIKTFGSQLSS